MRARVSFGAITSCTVNRAAALNGSVPSLKRASISRCFAAGSGARWISSLNAAATPPETGSDAKSAVGQATIRLCSPPQPPITQLQ